MSCAVYSGNFSTPNLQCVKLPVDLWVVAPCALLHIVTGFLFSVYNIKADAVLKAILTKEGISFEVVSFSRL